MGISFHSGSEPKDFSRLFPVFDFKSPNHEVFPFTLLHNLKQGEILNVTIMCLSESFIKLESKVNIVILLRKVHMKRSSLSQLISILKNKRSTSKSNARLWPPRCTHLPQINSLTTVTLRKESQFHWLAFYK